MRLGIIRDAYFLPPPAEQRAALEGLACDRIHEEAGSDFVADRRIHHVLFQLDAGDEVAMQGLGVLCRPQGRPAHLVRDLLEAGVTLTVVPARGQAHRLEADARALELISLLATHERERGPGRKKAVHQGGSRNPLSKYQIEYARKLYSEGESLRTIGLLFQLSPSHVLDVVSPPRPNQA